MTPSTGERPYEPVGALLDLAADWAAADERERGELGLVLSQLRQRGDWRLSIHRTPERGVGGVSVVLQGGQWFLEAGDEMAALLLANMAVVGGRIPATLTTSEQAGAWLRPHLAATGHLSQENPVSTMVCREARGGGRGQWAGPQDLPALRAFDDEFKAAGLEFRHPAWEILIGFRDLAILLEDGAVAATVQRFGKIASGTGIANVRAAPRLQGSGAESALIAFVVEELLRESPAVVASLGAGQAAEAELLASSGFVTTATRYGASFS